MASIDRASVLLSMTTTIIRTQTAIVSECAVDRRLILAWHVLPTGSAGG